MTNTNSNTSSNGNIEIDNTNNDNEIDVDVDVVGDIEDFHVKHEEAMRDAQSTYIDPATGFTVFSELTHLKRGKCCGNRCRHCPYGFEKVKVPGSWRSRSRRKNSKIDPTIPPPPPVIIPGAPVSKLRSGDMETAQRMVREILERAGKLDDDACWGGKIAINESKNKNKNKNINKDNAIDEDDDLSSTSSSSCSSSSCSSSSSSSSTSTSTSSGSSADINTPTTISVINDAIKNNETSSAATTAATSTTSTGSTTTTTTENNNNNNNPPCTAITTNNNDANNANANANANIKSNPTKMTTTKNVPYTRSGDQGTSQLGTGERRSKTDDAFEAMGTVDELCSFVGVVHSHLLLNKKKNYDELPVRLLDVMSRLFDVGSHVAKPPTDHVFRPNGIGDGFDADYIDDLEEWIDEMTEDLPELTSFILPTGAQAAAALHVARTVCRRAERRLVPLVVNHKTCDPNALRYLNRLSDFFFVSARWVNYKEGQEEIEYRLDMYDDDDNDEQRERVHRSLTTTPATTTSSPATPDEKS